MTDGTSSKSTVFVIVLRLRFCAIDNDIRAPKYATALLVMAGMKRKLGAKVEIFLLRNCTKVIPHC